MRLRKSDRAGRGEGAQGASAADGAALAGKGSGRLAERAASPLATAAAGAMSGEPAEAVSASAAAAAPKFRYSEEVRWVHVDKLLGWEHSLSTTGLSETARANAWEANGIPPIPVVYFPEGIGKDGRKSYMLTDGHHRLAAARGAKGSGGNGRVPIVIMPASGSHEPERLWEMSYVFISYCVRAGLYPEQRPTVEQLRAVQDYSRECLKEGKRVAPEVWAAGCAPPYGHVHGVKEHTSRGGGSVGTTIAAETRGQIRGMFPERQGEMCYEEYRAMGSYHRLPGILFYTDPATGDEVRPTTPDEELRAYMELHQFKDVNDKNDEGRSYFYFLCDIAQKNEAYQPVFVRLLEPMMRAGIDVDAVLADTSGELDAAGKFFVGCSLARCGDSARAIKLMEALEELPLLQRRCAMAVALAEGGCWEGCDFIIKDLKGDNEKGLLPNELKVDAIAAAYIKAGKVTDVIELLDGIIAEAATADLDEAEIEQVIRTIRTVLRELSRNEQADAGKGFVRHCVDLAVEHEGAFYTALASSFVLTYKASDDLAVTIGYLRRLLLAGRLGDGVNLMRNHRFGDLVDSFSSYTAKQEDFHNLLAVLQEHQQTVSAREPERVIHHLYDLQSCVGGIYGELLSAGGWGPRPWVKEEIDALQAEINQQKQEHPELYVTYLEETYAERLGQYDGKAVPAYAQAGYRQGIELTLRPLQVSLEEGGHRELAARVEALIDGIQAKLA